ncbi:RHS repeat-associated core domain-containing protein [Cystobacter fuscus]|uniref:RHS repeat-associated core domain-containing protein n=1 Tax=Cystobacter fuscus TaxID=43 RepID=A0A250JCV1_9BACT|nr:hypothetical protein [Cystobacter fuscus]ATB41221.1 RHS repeat-associated core domain-containing protein [Cystobacter fuscus]
MNENAPYSRVENFGTDELDDARDQFNGQYLQGMAGVVSVLEMAIGNGVNSSTKGVSAAVASKIGANNASTRMGQTFFHGTDIDSARRLLRGETLDAAKAMAKKLDGPAGFYLTDSYDAAAYYYAARRSPGGVLEYTLSTEATKSLTAAGAKFGQTPLGNMHDLGNEFFIPIQAFELFNELRQAGQIVVRPR